MQKMIRSDLHIVINSLVLISYSTPVAAVISSSLVISAFPKSASIIIFAALINDSWIPSKCDPRGGCQYHLILLLGVDCCVFVLSNVFISSCRSLFAQIKFVLLSDIISVCNF